MMKLGIAWQTVEFFPAMSLSDSCSPVALEHVGRLADKQQATATTKNKYMKRGYKPACETSPETNKLLADVRP